MKVCNGDMLMFDQIHVLKPNFEDSVIREWEHDGFFIVKRIFVENLYIKIVSKLSKLVKTTLQIQ